MLPAPCQPTLTLAILKGAGRYALTAVNLRLSRRSLDKACSLRPIPRHLAYGVNSLFTWAKDLGQGSAFCRAAGN